MRQLAISVSSDYMNILYRFQGG